MVEIEGLEKHSNQIITDFIYITEAPKRALQRLFTTIKDKNINAN